MFIRKYPRDPSNLLKLDAVEISQTKTDEISEIHSTKYCLMSSSLLKRLLSIGALHRHILWLLYYVHIIDK